MESGGASVLLFWWCGNCATGCRNAASSWSGALAAWQPLTVMFAERCSSALPFCICPMVARFVRWAARGGAAVWDAACGLKWRDEQMQQQLAAVSNADAVYEPAADVADVAPAQPVAAAAAPFPATSRKASEPWECLRCTVTSTTCRRSGPGGRSTLCNGTLSSEGGMVRGGEVVGDRGGGLLFGGLSMMSECGEVLLLASLS